MPCRWQPEAPGWLYPTLALIGMLNAAIGGWYYLRIITVMYLRTSVKPIATSGTLQGLATLIICVILTLALGIPPGATGSCRPRSKLQSAPAPPQPMALSQNQ